jgi:hypothetical protein
MFIDEKPATGQMWSSMVYHNVTDKYLQKVLPGLDYAIVAIPFAVGENRLNRLYPPTWIGENEYDWSYIDTQAKRVLKVRPDAKMILMLAFDGAKWWTDKNPGSANPEVDIDRGIHESGVPGPKGIPDYLSPKWKKASRTVLRQLVAHVQSSDWGKSVIGYELFNGNTMDCNFKIPHNNDRVKRDFKEALKLKYKTNSELQKAWNVNNITFKTANPITKIVPNGIIIEPFGHQHFLDSREFFNNQYREVFSDFSANIKEATQGKSLVGVRTGNFYGNDFWNSAWVMVGEDSGWLPPLLNDENIDYIDVQEPYSGRQLGHGSGVPVLPIKALYEYKKAIFIQNDVRTHLSKPNVGYGRTPDIESTIQLQRRVFVNSFISGTIPYLFQLDFSYFQTELLAEYRLQKNIWKSALNNDRGSVAEIAFVFDPEMRLHLGNDDKHTAPSRYFALFDYTKHVWQRAGVPFDMIFLDQIKELPPYKIYVFCNTWRLNKKQQQIIKDKVFKNGQTAVFLWSDGLIHENGKFDSVNLRELTGLDILMSKNPQTWEMAATSALDDLIKIKAGTEIGILGNENYDKPEAADAGQWTFSPSFYINSDDNSIVLARRKNNQSSAAMRLHPDYTTIYSASGNVTVPLMKLALKKSGAFEYTNSQALIMINKSYVGFHTYKDEIIELKLPKKEVLKDLFSGKLYPANTVHYIDVKKNSTYLLKRGE